MRHTFLTSLFCLPLFAAPLHAAFVLDDFDDVAGVNSPGMLEEIVTTHNVGSLSGERGLRIAATASGPRAPIASLDISSTVKGAMRAVLENVGTTQGGDSPLFAFQFNYDFTPTDISESGLNNAILFDFSSIEATESPLFLRVIVRDDTNLSSFQNHVYNLPLSSGPFVAVMPFDNFTLRGGSPGLPDYTTIDEMDFDFFFLRPSLDIQWSAQLDRIRFGRIPEPLSLSLFVIGLFFLAGCRQRNCG